MEYRVGQQLLHKYTKRLLWVLEIAGDKILCRTEDLREIWFYKSELETLEGVRESNTSTRFL